MSEPSNDAARADAPPSSTPSGASSDCAERAQLEVAANGDSAAAPPAPSDQAPPASAGDLAESLAGGARAAAAPAADEGEVTRREDTDAAASAPDAAQTATAKDRDAAPLAPPSADDSPPPFAGESAGNGQLERLQALAAVIHAEHDKTTVIGKVIGWNKGGFHVSIDGVPAFCPKSQIEIGNPRKSASYIDRELGFRVIEIRNGGKRIVVSRAEVLKEEREERLAKTRAKLEVGAVLDGRVSSLTDFGAFVDLGGIEGLVHLSKLSHRRVEHPKELLKTGQRVQVQVIKLEKGGNRISLSMKDLEPDPWAAVAERYPAGTRLTGKILRATDFGLFVEVEPGLEGLVHTSQLPLGMAIDDARLAAGETATCWVREVDGQRRRLALAMREVATADPWTDLAKRYTEGSEVEGVVEQVAKFGVFVQLEPGLTGLLPFSQLSLPEGQRAERSFAAGQSIPVVIEAIDRKRRRISLVPRGKQLEGTRADYRDYQRRHQRPRRESGGLNALAAAFAKLQESDRD